MNAIVSKGASEAARASESTRNERLRSSLEAGLARAAPRGTHVPLPCRDSRRPCLRSLP
jgi:hypothetical protein